MTSMPMRGMIMPPHCLEPQFCATRQRMDWSLLRSQWKRTRMRPYSSQSISSPSLPTTNAVCGPCTSGRGVTCIGWNGFSALTNSYWPS